MMRDGRLCETYRVGQFAYARLCDFMCSDERDEPKASRISQRLESAGQRLCFIRLNDIPHKRRAAFAEQRQLSSHGLHRRRHKTIMAYIDKCQWDAITLVASTTLNASEGDHD
jgi:hypothetical protein